MSTHPEPRDAGAFDFATLATVPSEPATHQAHSCTVCVDQFTFLCNPNSTQT